MEKKHFNGSIVIADPSYFVTSEEDWEKCEYGEHMEKLGFTDFLYIEYEEDVQEVVNVESQEKYGEICSDSCAMVVAYKEELANYNPDYEKDLGGEDNRAIIDNFDGEVTSELVPYKDDDYEGEDTVIVGTGNISFKSRHKDEVKVAVNLELQDKIASILAEKMKDFETEGIIYKSPKK
jgi:hypothetical protein